MIYLKSTLAGLGGSIVALILLIAAVVILNILKVSKSGMVGIGIVGPIPVGVVMLGFVLGFYMVFRNSN